MTVYDVGRNNFIDQQRGLIKDQGDNRTIQGVVYAVNLNDIDIQLGGSGTVIQGVPVVGGTNAIIPGDVVYIMYFGAIPVAISTRSWSGGISSPGTADHNHDTRYYTDAIVDSKLAKKSDIGHSHSPTDITAKTGHIGKWTIDGDGIYDAKTRISGLGYINFGSTPSTNWGYPSWATDYGVWIGWDYGITDLAHAGTPIYQNDPEGNTTAAGPKMAFYKNPTNYLLWTGSKLLVKATNFTLDGSGNITASGGTIGGWTINSTYLAKDTGTNATSAGLAPLDYPFFGGATYANRATAPFRVSNAGAITATSGTIGAWTLTSSTIHSTSITLDNTNDKITVGAGIILDGANQKITVGASGNTVVVDGSAKLVKSSNFSSGLAGFQMDSSGNAEFDNIIARGAIKTAVFEKSLVTAFAGSQIIAKSASVLAADTTATGTTFSISVNAQAGAAPFASGDRLRFSDGTNTTWATVGASSGTGPYTYTATYQSGSSSATYKTGQSVVDYTGSGGGGWLFHTADDTNGPFMSVQTSAGSPWSDGVEQLRIGNLNGNWGYAAATYGLAIGKYGTNLPNITVETTNGLRIRSNTTTVIQLDTSGNADISSKLRMPGASSAIAIGSTPPTSSSAGTGIWIDRTGFFSLASGTYQVKIDATTGALLAGGGDIKIESGGMSIGGTNTRLSFYDTNSFSNLITSITTYLSGGWSGLTLQSQGISGNVRSQIELNAVGYSVGSALTFHMSADDVSAQSYAFFNDTFGTFKGLMLGSNSGTPGAMLDVRGTVAASNTATITITDSGTNNTAVAAKVIHRTSGTPTTGFGALLQFQSDSSTNTVRTQGQINSAWATSTDGSQTARMEMWVNDNAGARLVLRAESSGSVPMIGFLGAGAVARPTAYTQTYSTTTRTHANLTASNPPAGGTGTAAGGYDTAAHRDAMITSLTNLIADVTNVKQVLNQVIDDLQSNGLLA